MAKVKIRIPQVQRKITNNQHIVDAVGETVAGAIDDLIRQFPELEKRIKNAEGQINKFLIISLEKKGKDAEDIRFLEKQLQTELGDGDEISIIPAAAGG
jgi:molybdopterin converting factor small subunit